ncbi:MAG: 30S ribosomal protein S9 [Candidatus Micrarchaeota archaeon]
MAGARKPKKEREKKPHAPQKKERKERPRVVETRGKRKESIARASVKQGSGRLCINNRSIDSIDQPYIREIITEPLALAGDAAKTLDIDIVVFGGGTMGQAQAVRTAIARGLVEFTHNEELKKLMIERDRHMLVEDSRRVEPKKYKGPKARARYQKSYR